MMASTAALIRFQMCPFLFQYYDLTWLLVLHCVGRRHLFYLWLSRLLRVRALLWLHTGRHAEAHARTEFSPAKYLLSSLMPVVMFAPSLPLPPLPAPPPPLAHAPTRWSLVSSSRFRWRVHASFLYELQQTVCLALLSLPVPPHRVSKYLSTSPPHVLISRVFLFTGP